MRIRNEVVWNSTANLLGNQVKILFWIWLLSSWVLSLTKKATLTLFCIMLEWLPRFLSICVHTAWDFKPTQCDTTCSLVVRTIAFGIGINITLIYLVIRSGACSSCSGRRLVGQGETQGKSHVLCNPWIITSFLRWNEWAM